MPFTNWWMKWRTLFYWVVLAVFVAGLILNRNSNAPSFLTWGAVFCALMLAGRLILIYWRNY
jgi:hypothetical protein